MGRAAAGFVVAMEGQAVNQAQAAELVMRGGGLHAQGRLLDALGMFDAAIASNPMHADAFAGRGDVLTDLGDFDLSIVSYDRAIELAPGRAEFHDYRGIAFARMGRFEEALESLDRALAMDPGNVNAMNNRANVLKLLKRPQEALDQIDRVIQALPGFAAAHNNRGNALIELGRCSEAIASFDRALDLAPAQTDVLSNRAMALLKLGRSADAADAYRHILDLDPNHADSLRNLADLHVAEGRRAEAMDCLGRALALRPDDLDSLLLMAFLHTSQMGLEEAIVYYRRIVALDNMNFSVFNNLGIALSKTGNPEEALACYDRAIELEPENSLGYYNRAWLLKEWRHYDEALEAMDRCLALNPTHPQALETRLNLAMSLAHWEDAAAQREELKARVENGVEMVTPFPMLSIVDDPAIHRKCAERYAAMHWGAAPDPDLPRSRTGGRIRIGYLSADFYDHATLYLLMDALEAHDRERFEIFGISFGPRTDDPWRRRAETAFEKFIDIHSTPDADALQAIWDLELDIAVDLKGYTANLRTLLFSRRVAPVQVNYLGFPGTMGADWMDYLIADPIVIPADRQEFYSEKIVYLPGCYQPNSPAIAPLHHSTREDWGLPQGKFIFCCFNSLHKIWPETFRVWARILSRVDNSVLWLWADGETARRNILGEATRAGLADGRIIFASKAARDAHLERLRHADLFLDTLPYNAHTTASDALRAGVPLLTCPGQSFQGRVSASLLTALGLPELIAEDMEQYEEMAVALATDPPALARTERKLSANIAGNTLFDPVQAARKLEAAFEAMHARRQAGLAPDHIYL